MCNRCHKSKPTSRFELMVSGSYYRPTCKDCYNKRRRDLHGGAERDVERRAKLLDRIVSEISDCSIIERYVGNSNSRRVKLMYKGFEWDIRLSNFLRGKRPWSRYCNKDHQKGYFIYQLLSQFEEVLYIGKSLKLAQRLSKHFSPSEVERYQQNWKKDVGKVLACKCRTEADMHFIEMYMINKIKPKHNKEGASKDEITYQIETPHFKEIWVSQVYDKECALSDI